ncbi:MAG: aminoacyl-tRNA hydrolase [Clostridia bacterium]|nr:aminoacyl-tRNA hydrolase [Clostridia bacterium]
MFIIVGLGNPGREYASTRHNVGFMTLDILAQRWDIDIRKKHCRSLLGDGRVVGERIILAAPTTFMNNSGEAVRDLMNFYKCEHDKLILIYDDADIDAGTIRIRSGGSSGTHNGMRSVIYQLGFDDFPRVRIGIGKPQAGRDMMYHVLASPTGEEKDKLTQALSNAADAVEMIVNGKLSEA